MGICSRIGICSKPLRTTGLPAHPTPPCEIAVTLSRATTNTQSRSATLFSTNCWATRVLEMQMRVTDGEEKEIMPLTAERILLRDVRELRELDERIRRIAANAALLK